MWREGNGGGGCACVVVQGGRHTHTYTSTHKRHHTRSFLSFSLVTSGWTMGWKGMAGPRKCTAGRAPASLYSGGSARRNLKMPAVIWWGGVWVEDGGEVRGVGVSCGGGTHNTHTHPCTTIHVHKSPQINQSPRTGAVEGAADEDDAVPHAKAVFGGEHVHAFSGGGGGVGMGLYWDEGVCGGLGLVWVYGEGGDSGHRPTDWPPCSSHQ